MTAHLHMDCNKGWRLKLVLWHPKPPLELKTKAVSEEYSHHFENAGGKVEFA